MTGIRLRWIAAVGFLLTTATPTLSEAPDRHALCKGAAAEDEAYEAFAKRERIRENRRRPAMRIFDNLYFVGTSSTLAWVLDTAQGLILLDSLNAPDIGVITSGLASLGLDPARLRYVIVSHGHADHYGGATVLQQTYGTRVVMGKADWPYAAGRHPAKEPPPARDLDAPANLSLGGATIRLIPTPGHTPGAISMLFTVRDKGKQHKVAMIAGIGKPDRDADLAAYFDALEHFRDAAWRAKADVIIAGHPFNDDSLAKMRRLSARKPGESNPFVIGRQAVRDALTTSLECGKAAFAARIPAR